MITYKVGDLFENINSVKNKIIIPHIVNNNKKWGSGFVVPLGNKWPIAKETYLNAPDLFLGETQFVKVSDSDNTIWVANMIAQNGLIGPMNPKPIKYSALIKCMQKVADTVVKNNYTEIYAPMFGSQRAGGNWELIEELINEIWKDIPVTIFKLEE